MGYGLCRVAADRPPTSEDIVFVLSVGGGDCDRNVGLNLVRALECAAEIDAGIVGRDGGFTARVGSPAVIVPTVNPARRVLYWFPIPP